jgi:hypothetical protein
VFLADSRSRLAPYGGRVRQVMRLRSAQDENALTAPPTHTIPFPVNLWMSEPAR